MNKCSMCNGDGWYIDHSDRHYGTGDYESCEQAGCPIQRECEACQGTGIQQEPEQTDESLPLDNDLPF